LWVAKLKLIANCLILASIALRAVLVIKRRQVEALVSIIQGRYYLAAALAGLGDRNTAHRRSA
jgi:hypothetical protein